MKKLIIYTVFAVMVSSCHIYRNFPETTTVDKELYGQEYVSADTSTLASLSWRELFTDMYLQRLVDSALLCNTDLRVARLRTEQAEALLLNARLSYLPSLGLLAEGTLDV